MERKRRGIAQDKRENINLKALHRINCFENNNWEINKDGSAALER